VAALQAMAENPASVNASPAQAETALKAAPGSLTARVLAVKALQPRQPFGLD
jgi:hypothetical protein